MKTLLLAALLASQAAPIFAQSFGASGKGTTAATFLELGVGGRAMGLGGAYTAAADGADALYWNPAALTRVERRSATFMHAAYLQSSYYDYGAYAQNLGAAGAYGVGFQYLNAGSIQQTDANFNQVGSFTPYDLALSVGYAKKLDFLGGLSAGLSVKYIQSRILATAKTAAFDAGLLSPPYFDKRLTLGAAATNLGGTLKFASERDNLPLTFKAGGAFRATPRWLLAADVGAPRDDTSFVAVGTEYALQVKDAWSVAGRTGYTSRTPGDGSSLSGWSLGVGFGSKSMSFDYAFAPLGGLGVTNRFSAAMKW